MLCFAHLPLSASTTAAAHTQIKARDPSVLSSFPPQAMTLAQSGVAAAKHFFYRYSVFGKLWLSP